MSGRFPRYDGLLSIGGPIGTTAIAIDDAIVPVSNLTPAAGPNPPSDPAAGVSLPFVSPAFILEQREAGWPDIHPEDYCHKCGVHNTSWYVRREQWLCATARWAEETGREGICCIPCFAQMFTEATGEKIVCEVVLHDARSNSVVSLVERALQVTPPPVAAEVCVPDPDYTAAEGDVSAEALGAAQVTP